LYYFCSIARSAGEFVPLQGQIEVVAMVDEPENLVLVQLRDVRSELQGIRAKLSEHDGRFDQLDKRFDDFHLLVNHALGLGTANQVKAREPEAEQEATKARQLRMDERQAEIERRLGKVEEKSDT
jgi:hypothetical protein